MRCTIVRNQSAASLFWLIWAQSTRERVIEHFCCHWYAQVLELPHLYSFGTLSFFDCNGTGLMLTSQHEDGTQECMAFFKDPDGRPLALMAQKKD
jgi:hypothetical protein